MLAAKKHYLYRTMRPLPPPPSPLLLVCLRDSHRQVPRFRPLRPGGHCRREKSGNRVLQHLKPERVVPHARAGPSCPLVPGLEDLERPEAEEGRRQPCHDLADGRSDGTWETARHIQYRHIVSNRTILGKAG